MSYHYFGPPPQPPCWGQPVGYPPMDPRRPPASGISLKDAKKLRKFCEEIIKEEEEKKKGKKPDDKNNDKRTATFNTVQWMALLMLSSPFLGLAYLKLLTALAASLH